MKSNNNTPGLRFGKKMLAAAAAFTAFAAGANAAAIDWNAEDGAWEESSNWSPARVPGRGETASINNAGRVVITAAAGNIYELSVGSGEVSIRGGSLSSVNAVIGSGVGAGTMGTMTIAAGETGTGELDVNSVLSVGKDGGNGMLSILTGGNVFAANTTVGDGLGSIGEIRVIGGGLDIANGTLNVGNNAGAGTLAIADAGSVSAASVFIGRDAGSTGKVTVESDGELSGRGDITVGYDGGNGELEVTGGTVSTEGRFSIGSRVGTVGKVTVFDGNVIAQHLGVGDNNGEGTLEITGGKVTVGKVLQENNPGTVSVGSTGGTGTIAVTGGELEIKGALTIADGGTGTLSIEGGLVKVESANGILLGRGAGDNATLTLKGGVLETTGIVNEFGSNAVVNLNGGTIKATADNSSFFEGCGDLTLDGTGLDGAAALTFDVDGDEKSVAIDNKLIYADTGIALKKTGSGTLTLSGASEIGAEGSVAVDAGTLTLENGEAVGSGTATLAEGTALNLNFDDTFAGKIAGAGALNIGGDVTLNKAADEFTGDTTIAGTKTLTLQDAGATGSGKVMFNGVNGALNLGFDGTFTGTFAGEGILIVDGDVTLDKAAADFTGNTTVNDTRSLTLEDANAVGAGSVALGTDSALNLNFDGTFANTVEGTGAMNIGGDVTLNQANAGFTGDTTVADTKTLTLEDAGATGSGKVTLNGADSALGMNFDGTFTGTLAGDGALNVNGNVTLNQASDTFTGVTNNAGTLTLGNAEAIGTAGTANLAEGSTLNLNFDGTFANTVEGFGAMNIGGDVTLSQANAGFTGDTTVTDGKTLTLEDAGATGSGKLTIAGETGAANFDFDGTFAGSIAGEGALNLNGDITLNQDSSEFSGEATVADAKSLTLEGANAIGAGNVTLGAGSALNLNFDSEDAFAGSIAGTGSLNVNGDITLENASEAFSGDTTVADTKTLTLGDANALGTGKVVFGGADSALNLNFDGTFANTIEGGGSLNVGETGNVTLDQANAGFTGVTNNAGTLTLGNAEAIGTAGTANLAEGSTLNLNFDGAFAGTLAGEGAMNIGGDVTLSQANAGFTGDTTVTDGKTLTLEDAGATGSGKLTIAGETGAANFDFDGTFAGSIAGEGALNLNGDITLNQNSSEFSGEATVADAKTLTLENENAVGSGNVTLGTDSALNMTFNGTFNGSVTGSVADTVALTVDGNITLAKNSENFIGDTKVTDGKTLTLGDASATGTGKVILDGADSSLNLDFDGTFAGEIEGSGALNVNAGGNVTLDNSNANFTGIATNYGTLTLANAEAIGANNIALTNETGATVNVALVDPAEVFAGDITNSGTLNATSAITGDLVNNGGATANIDGGFTGDITNTGTLNANSAITGDVTNNAGATAMLGTVSGAVTNGGNINLATTQTDFVWGDLANTGNIDFVNAGNKLTVDRLSGNGTLRMNIDANNPANGNVLVVTGAIAAGTKQAIELVDQTTGNINNVTSTTEIEVVSITNGLANPADVFSSNTIDIGAYAFAVSADGKAKVSTLSAGSAAAMNTIGAMSVGWFTQLDNLTKRMGELRLKTQKTADVEAGKSLDLWIRGYGRETRSDLGIAGVADFKEYQYGSDIGGDKIFAIDESNELAVGAFVGYQGSKRHFHDTYNNKGETDSVYAGLYTTWINADGWYIDGVVKGQYFDNSYTAGQDAGKFDSYGLGASIEFGKQCLSETGWFVEPSLQVAYTHVFGDSYATDRGLGVTAGDSNIWRFAGNVRFGKNIVLADASAGMSGWGVLQPYAKIGLEEQGSTGGEVRISDSSLSPNTDGRRMTYGAGLIWQLDAAQQVHVDYEGSFGDKYDTPWSVNVGYRVRF